MSFQYDLVVIGSGPGGYVGAIRAAQLGFNVAVVEKDKAYGGTCLNVGCIPSKALLDSSEHFANIAHQFPEHGIEVSGAKFDLKKMMARKDKVVEDSTKGIAYLFDKNKIKVHHGYGQIKSANEVQVSNGNKTEVITAANIMIATGSVPNALPALPFDGKKVVSSTEALMLPKVPKKLVVVGGGAIGLEMGSVWLRLGADVTVIEYANKICGPMDDGLSKRLMMILKKQGMKFITQAKVTGADETKSGLNVKFENLKDGSADAVECDVCLVAVGRGPFTEKLGLENVGIQKNERGFIQVNEHYQTSVPNIFAIGDVIPGPMLAHKAEEEGVAVAEILAGQAGHVNYNTVPYVVYTWPEFAAVGQSEEQLKAAGRAYNAGQFPFSANGRARAANDADGMVKVLADKTTDEILGVHIVGPRASDILSEAVVAMEFGASSEDLARSFHAHPTFSEAIREAALAVEKRVRQI